MPECDLDALFDLATREQVRSLENYTRAQWGERCEEYEPECCLCRVWRAVDAFKAATDLS